MTGTMWGLWGCLRDGVPWWWIALFATLFTAVIVVAFWRKRKEKGTDGEGSPEEEHVT